MASERRVRLHPRNAPTRTAPVCVRSAARALSSRCWAGPGRPCCRSVASNCGRARCRSGVALMVVGLFTAAHIVLLLLHALLGHPRSRSGRRFCASPRPPSICRPLRALAGRSRKSKTIAVSPKTSIRPRIRRRFPLIAIRGLQRESKINPGSDRLVIVHDLAPMALVHRAIMMHPSDFDDLDALLRTALKSLAK